MMPSSPTYQRALTTFGFDRQADKTIEELGELITTLQHFRFKDAAPELVITELADVMIMCQQLACHFGIDKVQSEIIFKLNRLEEMINAAKDTPIHIDLYQYPVNNKDKDNKSPYPDLFQ